MIKWYNSSYLAVNFLGFSCRPYSFYKPAGLVNWYVTGPVSHMIPIIPRFYSTSGMFVTRKHKNLFKSNNNHFNFQKFSTTYKLNVSKNPLELEDGEYDYIRNVKMNEHLRWKKGQKQSKKLGVIGYKGYTILDYDYVNMAYERLNNSSLEKFPSRSIENYEEKFNYIIQKIYIGIINEVKINSENLYKIFKSFNPLNSYSIAFIVYHTPTASFYTIGKHYLVNNTTNAYELMNNVYNQFENLSVRYSFLASDSLMIKYWPLNIKVQDPNFSKSKIGDTQLTEIKNNQPSVKNKYFSNSFVPLTMDFHIYYGILINKKGNTFEFILNERIIKVEVISLMVVHKITVYDMDSRMISEILDYSYGCGFIRAVGWFQSKNSEIDYEGISKESTLLYIKDFKVENIEYRIKTKSLTTMSKEYISKKKIIALDIESYKNEKNTMIPYACSFYDGRNTNIYYLTDFKDWHDMIEKMIDDLMVLKYKGYTVYAHNFNKFDSAFLFRRIKNKYKISNLLPRDTGLLCFNVKHKVNNKTIILRFSDSIALLPFSLASLGESFNVDVKKDVFPHDFVNETNLNYVGPLPDYKYFTNSIDMAIKYTDMAKVYHNNWDLRYELSNYLKKDVVSLYQILQEMHNVIFNNYRINITSKPTIASLSLSILRSNFLDKNLHIPQTRGNIERAIRLAYYGGRSEVFKPLKYKLWAYDYNSLYPSAMLKDLPVGQPVFSLVKDLDKIFGYVKVRVTSPDGIKIPILPTRVITQGGDEKLVFPTGTWEGWYFSEEVKLAKKYGYKIEVIESYIFERGHNIFKNYVVNMAEYKDNSTGAMRNIHKLLMNTPYGRMGMKDIRDVVKIVNAKKYEEIAKRFDILMSIHFSENEIFVKYTKLPSKMACDQSGLNYDHELMNIMENDFVQNSTPIAAAIASWARIIMYPMIVNSAYTDTDSIYLDKPLDDSMIGKSIGKFKIEYGGIIYKALFISSKLYYLNTRIGEISKAKGITIELSKFDFLNLYNNINVPINDTRWKRNLIEESVTILDQMMILKPDYDKRNKLFSKGKWVDTSPLVINEKFKVIPLDLVIYKQQSIVVFNKNIINLNKNLIQFNNISLELISYVHSFRIIAYQQEKFAIVSYQPQNLALISLLPVNLNIVKIDNNAYNICISLHLIWKNLSYSVYYDDNLKVYLPKFNNRWWWLGRSDPPFIKILKNDFTVKRLYEGNDTIKINPLDKDDWKLDMISSFINLIHKLSESPQAIRNEEITNVFIYWYLHTNFYKGEYIIEMLSNYKWIIRRKTIYEIEVEKSYLGNEYDIYVLSNPEKYDLLFLADSNMNM